MSTGHLVKRNDNHGQQPGHHDTGPNSRQANGGERTERDSRAYQIELPHTGPTPTTYRPPHRAHAADIRREELHG
jgi:hypothetical protein